MGGPATGQAALRHSPPTPAAARTTAPAEHTIPSGAPPSTTPGPDATAAAGAAALICGQFILIVRTRTKSLYGLIFQASSCSSLACKSPAQHWVTALK